MSKHKTKKASHKQVCYSVLISKMFPADDPIAIDLLRLMSGCNDVYFLEEWVNGTKHVPTGRQALSIAAGRNALQFRLMYSFLHESLSVVRDLTKRSDFDNLRPLLGGAGEMALTELLSIKLVGIKSTSKDWGVNESILRARHTATFHYDFAKVQEALNHWLEDHPGNEEAYIVFQDKTRAFGKWPYYSIADMVRAEIAFGIRNSNHEKNLNEALKLMTHLETFTDSLFFAYIKDRQLDKFIRPYAAKNAG